VEDGQVLDELKKLSEVHLRQIFELQRQVAKYQAIMSDNNVSQNVVKFLKLGQEKRGSKQSLNMREEPELFPMQ
jgi:hypothetical protein